MCLAVPGKLVSIVDRPGTEANDSLWRMGKVSFGGILKEVSLAYLPDAQVGDYVIVHVGFALSIVDEQEAEQTLALSIVDEQEAEQTLQELSSELS